MGAMANKEALSDPENVIMIRWAKKRLEEEEANYQDEVRRNPPPETLNHL